MRGLVLILALVNLSQPLDARLDWGECTGDTQPDTSAMMTVAVATEARSMVRKFLTTNLSIQNFLVFGCSSRADGPATVTATGRPKGRRPIESSTHY